MRFLGILVGWGRRLGGRLWLVVRRSWTGAVEVEGGLEGDWVIREGGWAMRWGNRGELARLFLSRGGGGSEE